MVTFTHFITDSCRKNTCRQKLFFPLLVRVQTIIISHLTSMVWTLSLRLPLCRCSGSTGRGGRQGPRRQTAPGVSETTWNRRRNHSCPRRSTGGGCSAERQRWSHLVFRSQIMQNNDNLLIICVCSLSANSAGVTKVRPALL